MNIHVFITIYYYEWRLYFSYTNSKCKVSHQSEIKRYISVLYSSSCLCSYVYVNLHYDCI
jgi:hypothetical protein